MCGARPRSAPLDEIEALTLMAAPLVLPTSPDLDVLLAEVAEALQLTANQYARASQHYSAVADWLEGSGSSLARFQPQIYPQGSMALETTVRPISQEEYDLDLVCQMLSTGMTALQLYEAVYERLMSNANYARMVEKKQRCIRLNYAHEFHLDIIPAEPDLMRGRQAIRVPDRSLHDWTPSNPKGYVAWFKLRSEMGVSELRKAATLPGPTPAASKPVLAIVVQLIKRRRDVLFSQPHLAPRSVLLTTLAGEHYRGTDHVATALYEIVLGIKRRIREAAPRRISVHNPTNDGERFCESFTGPGRYEAFTQFIAQLERDAQLLLNTQGINALQQLLFLLFGSEPVAKAVRCYGELLKARRDGGTLKYTGARSGGLAIVPGAQGASRSVPSHRYFGGKG